MKLSLLNYYFQNFQYNFYRTTNLLFYFRGCENDFKALSCQSWRENILIKHAKTTDNFFFYSVLFPVNQTLRDGKSLISQATILTPRAKIVHNVNVIENFKGIFQDYYITLDFSI